MAIFSVLWDAIVRFYYDYGITLASAIAFSGVVALFPFLIFMTALAGFLGGSEVAELAVDQLFSTLPKEVAEGLAPEVRRVLGSPRTDILTLSVALTLIIASSGLETLRTALNRAYRLEETRSFWFRRAQSILFVIGLALAMLVLGFSVILGPTISSYAIEHFPWLADYTRLFDRTRYGVGGVVLLIALTAIHAWIPDGHRRLRDILPGILVTMVAWLIAAIAYSEYLAHYNYYTKTYAGLAHIMIALMFFYITALVFLFGGELNRAIIERRERLEEEERIESDMAEWPPGM